MVLAVQSDGQLHVFKAGQNSVTYHDQYSDGGGATYSECTEQAVAARALFFALE